MKPKIVVGNEFEYNSHDAMSMKQCYTTQKTKMSQWPLFKDASLRRDERNFDGGRPLRRITIAPHSTSNTVKSFSFNSRTTRIHCWTSASQPLGRNASSSCGNAARVRGRKFHPGVSVNESRLRLLPRTVWMSWRCDDRSDVSWTN